MFKYLGGGGGSGGEGEGEGGVGGGSGGEEEGEGGDGGGGQPCMKIGTQLRVTRGYVVLITHGLEKKNYT